MADMTELTENQKKLEEAFKKSQDSKTTAEAETARLNQVSQDAYKQTKLENEQAQNQYAQNISANQLTALDAIRRSNASAIASGANAGLSAANQLSSILGLQQDTTQEATDLANTAVDNAAQLNTQLNENAVTGAQTANEINAALGANEAELAKAMASNSAAIADIQAAEIAAKSQEKIAGVDTTTTTEGTTATTKSTAQQELEASQLESSKTNGANAIDTYLGSWQEGNNRTYPVKWTDPYTGETKGPQKNISNNGDQKEYISQYKQTMARIKAEMQAATTQAEYNEAYKKYQTMVNSTTTDNDGCLAPGTKITLADGSFKNVEDITNEDELLVWDMFIGNWSTAPILFVEHDEEIERDVITLNFAGNVTLDIIDDHGLFNLTLGKYVYIHNLEEAQSYVGHEFFYTEDKSIIGAILLGATVSRKKITAHSPCTARALCVIANGMLTMPGNTEPFTNVCKMSDYSICYDIKDLRDNIDKYGLFSEKDFEGVLPSNIFFAFQGPLLKIKIGRGETSMEEINKLITRYSKYLV